MDKYLWIKKELILDALTCGTYLVSTGVNTMHDQSYPDQDTDDNADPHEQWHSAPLASPVRSTCCFKRQDRLF
jgi:hypothetical protein